MKSLYNINKVYLGSLLAAISLTACEDYTEHNFGTDSELFKPSQVTVQNVTLTDANYADIAANEENIALATQDGVLDELQALPTNKYFTAGLTPADYIKPVLKSLVGTTQFYTMTAGSVINVGYKQECDMPAYLEQLQDIPSVTVEGTFTPTTLKEKLSDAIAAKMGGAQKGDVALVNLQYSEVELPVATEEESIEYPCYVKVTGAFPGAGAYLLVPQGLDVAVQYNPGKTYGYPYGVDIVRGGEGIIKVDENSEDACFTIEKYQDAWALNNGNGDYLYMKGTYNSFNYASSLEELAEDNFAAFSITPNEDGTYDIVNTENGKVFLWGASYNSAGAYLDKKGTEGYLSIELYKYCKEAPKKAMRKVISKLGYNKSIVCTFNGSKWVEYTTSGATVEPIDPSVYVSLGKTSLTNPDSTLPIYLCQTFPYAEKDKAVAIVYNNGKANVAAEYTYDGTQWQKTTNQEQGSVTYTLDEDGWNAKGDYLNQALTTIASTDANAIHEAYGWNIEYVGSIGELTYVWSATTSYGMKASAYANSTRYVTDAWAISPSMNFKKAKAPVLTFEEAQKYAGENLADYLQVWVSTDYAAEAGQAAAHWTNVTDKLEGERSDGSTWDFFPISLDLTAYAGQTNVVVAFRYVSNENYAATWEFKNIVCKEAE